MTDPDLDLFLDEVRAYAAAAATEAVDSALRQAADVHLEAGRVGSTDRQNGRADVVLTGGTVLPGCPVICVMPAVGDVVQVAIFPPNRPFIVGAVHGVNRLLGHVQNTATTIGTAIATGTGVTLSLSRTVSVRPGRLIRVEGHLPNCNTPSGGLIIALRVVEVVAGVAGVIGSADRRPVVAGQACALDGKLDIEAPASGPHTYQLWAQTSAGTMVVGAGAAGTTFGPAFMTIRDLGAMTDA